VKDLTIARAYASALFEIGDRHDEAESYGPPLHMMAEMFRSDPNVRRFFDTPRISAEKRRMALRSALEGRASERFVNFVLLVLKKGRQTLFPEMAETYQALLDERSGQHHAQVTLARQPDAATEAHIAERLTALLGQPVRPQITINPAIRGGLIVRYGDRWLDASLRRHLVALKREMIHARLPVLPAATTQEQV
jgi:F-type H+-transporting ATPase subunit delta